MGQELSCIPGAAFDDRHGRIMLAALGNGPALSKMRVHNDRPLPEGLAAKSFYPVRVAIAIRSHVGLDGLFFECFAPDWSCLRRRAENCMQLS